jgi:hypothetical protein
MSEISQRNAHGDTEPRHIVVLEFVAAAAVLLVIVTVLYMVFTYRPA